MLPVTRAADLLAALVFPQGCHVCGKAVMRRADGVACAACWSDPARTPLFGVNNRCERCGLPGEGACPRCAPSDLAAVRSCGFYAGALRAALLDLKRRPRPCRRLAGLVVSLYEREGILHGADVIVPVPLHPSRLRKRGHNQALVLAEVLARASGIAVCPRALARVRAGAPRRVGSDRAARAESARGAFHAARRLVANQRVLLVDDVFTTGATLGDAARALRAAGAREIVALTAARTR